MALLREEEAAHVLVVDDDPVGRELLVRLLRDEGYEVETAVDGEDAWQRLQQGDLLVDVVLLDWMMPRMNGMQLLEAIQEDSDFR